MSQKYNEVNTDVLIIGAGASGLWTALRFSELSPESSICVVDKCRESWGGLMHMAGGDLEAVIPPDQINEWMEDLVYYFDGLCDQTVYASILEASAARFKDYEKFGCEFFHNPDGSLKYVPQRGLPHIKLYLASQKGRGGQLMVKALKARLKDKNIKSIGRVEILDLLVENGKACGAVGFDYRTGEFYVFRARAVVIASGKSGFKTSFGANTATGEGLLLAWRAGCNLQDFEFSRVWNMPRQFAWEGQTHLFPLGARMINRLGENFMSKYSPVLGPNTDAHYTTIGMALEVRAGRGPITLDVQPVQDKDLIVLEPQTGWQKLNYDKLCKMGIDFFRDNTEWVPQIIATSGAICTKIDGSSDVPGLFVAGTIRDLEPGVYMGGFALMCTAATGYTAGETVAKFIREGEFGSKDPSTSDINACVKKAQALLKPANKTGVSPKEALTQIQKTIFPYDVCILKTEKSLARALGQMEQIKADTMPRMIAENPHELLKLKEVEAIAFVAEMNIRASLERKESRCGHYREDYPKMDPAGPYWYIMQRGEGAAPVFIKKQVPLQDYKIPYTKSYQNNFTFPVGSDS